MTPIARPARPEDVGEIVRICSAGWRTTYAAIRSPDEIESAIATFYAPERVRQEIAPAGPQWGGYVVAEDEGELLVAGGGGLTAPGVGELFVLYADPGRRRRGGGTAVLAFVSEQQREGGATEQWVSVQPHNALGIAFYRARGFVPRGRQPAFEGVGESLRMSRAL
jgi:GNAT superfamily N-acetyltransferase